MRPWRIWHGSPLEARACKITTPEGVDVIRCLICVLLFSFALPASADPTILLLLLRMARDKAISASLEAGVNSLRPESTIPSPTYGFALPTAPVPQGSEEQHVRLLLDNYFLHLTANQRDAVMADMHKILTDPAHAKDKAQIVAEFSLAAREVRDSYVRLDKLSSGEKRMLVGQAKEEFRRLPAVEREEMIAVLKQGTLPLPRDLTDSMLAEFNSVPPPQRE
jgi:hypothetical protein